MNRLKNKDNLNREKNIFNIILCLVLLCLIIIYLLFRNIFLGYEIKTVNYEHSKRNINIGVPKLSFFIKNRDRSYSFKNFRSSNIIENEIKKYLKAQKYLHCNDTIYYYNEKDDFSIINYSIKNHFFYTTVSYEIVDKNYCFTKQSSEYAKKLNGAMRFHTLNAEGFSLSKDKVFTPRLVVMFLDNVDISKQEFLASLEVRYLAPIFGEWNKISNKVIEKSDGVYEIKDDKLYYYRTKISEKTNDINIPEVSVFKIIDGKLILIDNYLTKYNQDIILD